MDELLKKEVNNIIKELKKQKKEALSKEISKNFNKTLLSYSIEINKHKTNKPIENTLKKAFKIELERLEYKKKEIDKILNHIEKKRFLQTAPHISPTQKPRFFFINYLSSLAKTKDDYLVIAMFSGIPFSNRTRPGRILFNNNEINLIPSYMQDALVYQHKITNKIVENFEKIDPNIKKFLEKMKEGEDYTKWALTNSKKIEEKIFKCKLVFIDFNEVIKNYLLLDLEKKNSILQELLFNNKNKEILENNFKNEVFFYKSFQNGKYTETLSYYLIDGDLQSNKDKINLNKENFKNELKNKSLCVGLPFGFLIFSFLNNFLCGGSFAQVEYLPKYKEKLLKIPILKNKIKNSPTGILTTGGFMDNLNLHSLDALMSNINLEKYKETFFAEAILSIKDVLLEKNYSGKYKKRKVNFSQVLGSSSAQPDRSKKLLSSSLKKQQEIYFIGICGKGLSGLAIALKQKGYKISGSDEGFYEPTLSLLVNNKIKFYKNYKKENIPKNVDYIVIGKHAKLTTEDNEEVKKAFSMKVPILSLPEAINKFINNKENTVIVGSFGKSTITSLIAFLLKNANKDPSYFIGAVPLDFKQNVHEGKGKDFIIEGDEYPSANWDNTSKMLYLKPRNAVLISGEHDHLNVFPKEKDYIAPYIDFIKLLPKDGILVASLNGKNVKKIIKNSKSKIVYYDLKNKKYYHAENIEFGEKTTFDLYKGNKKIINLETTLLGKHNIENIIGASAFLLEKKLITKIELQNGIKKFRGLSGRLDKKTDKSKVLVYEGFGSSYPKAKSIFDALKLHYPNKRLITIFEPHTFSWRNEESKTWYKNIFKDSDITFILPPPEHGSKTHNQISQEDIVNIVKTYKKEVYGTGGEEETLNILKNMLKEDDLIILITSGSLFGLTKSVPTLANHLFPKN